MFRCSDQQGKYSILRLFFLFFLKLYTFFCSDLPDALIGSQSGSEGVNRGNMPRYAYQMGKHSILRPFFLKFYIFICLDHSDGPIASSEDEIRDDNAMMVDTNGWYYF